jgi:hypothetical protein
MWGETVKFDSCSEPRSSEFQELRIVISGIVFAPPGLASATSGKVRAQACRRFQCL